MTRVFIHPLAGVLSAYGMGLADVRALRQQAVETRLSDDGARGGTEPMLRIARGDRRAAKWRAKGIDAARIGCTPLAASSNTMAPTRRWSCLRPAPSRRSSPSSSDAIAASTVS